MMMKKAIFFHVAIFSALAAAIPTSNNDSFTPATVTANVFKREISSEENWCNGKVESEGVFKPMSAVCDWELDRSFSVMCSRQDGPLIYRRFFWIQGYCPVGSLCEQREEALMWNNKKGYDIECVPAEGLVKWAMGNREIGHRSTQYCSTKTSYQVKGERTAVYNFHAEYFGITGQKTQINEASILFNGKSIKTVIDSNQVSTDHTIKAGDILQYCGVRGSDALIEGYAIAKIVKYLNADGTEEKAGDADDFTVVYH